ncbi:uncharacterized protein LOC122380002 [Amphibalanus amphitrite]|uniref:uncharacterized protein LOC122380002 n=1 Tax=Amphibalanus amphitrite TaxID=1232801 RepID=UPI001C8FEEFB|nr:uncharacterized protein LOC122380002 [Amphibalanus amphitrite]
MHGGLLRVGGRLRNSSLPDAAKFPIILPNKSKVTELLIQKVHIEIGHGGREHVLSEIRKTYWIIKGNSAVRRVLAKCHHCRRLYGQVKKQKMADLPLDRVTPFDPPFSSSGIDLFGPFFIKKGRGQAKRYGVIFTCLSMRAIHIEVASSLSTDSFICALRRFLARRGPIKQIRSDRGTNFVGAMRELGKELESIVEQNKTMQETLLKNRIQWRFNPPGASHFGGAWERMIKSVRKILDSLLHLQSLTEETLHTFLCEVEYILNSRPLTPVSADPKDLDPLSPNDILLSRGSLSIPVGVYKEEDLHGRKLWRQAQYLADQFWKRWQKEYLPLLQERSSNQTRQNNLAVSDVVLVADHTIPRGQWPLGLVTSVKRSTDGLVRSVSVRMRGKTVERPTNKLVWIERQSQ